MHAFGLSCTTGLSQATAVANRAWIARGAPYPHGRRNGASVAATGRMAGVVVLLVLGGCSIRGFEMRDHSMEPTISYSDRFLVDTTAYEDARPSRWDVVMIHCPDEPTRQLTLRVVGLPGETLSLVDGVLLIDEERTLPPPPIANIRVAGLRRKPQSVTDDRVLIVPQDHYYLLGDATGAYDSRFFGAVDAGYIEGRVLGVAERWADRSKHLDFLYEITTPVRDALWLYLWASMTVGEFCSGVLPS